MSLTRPRWVAKHTFGEHLEVPPRLLGIVKDGVGDRPGNAPGPQGLEPLRDVANDWHKARVNVSERGARLRSWGSESTTDRYGSAEAVAHGLHGVSSLGSVTARRARASGAEADEATTQ